VTISNFIVVREKNNDTAKSSLKFQKIISLDEAIHAFHIESQIIIFLNIIYLNITI